MKINLGKAVTSIISMAFLGWASWLSTTIIEVKTAVTEIQATYVQPFDMDEQLQASELMFNTRVDALDVKVHNVEEDIVLLQIDMAAIKSRWESNP